MITPFLTHILCTVSPSPKFHAYSQLAAYIRSDSIAAAEPATRRVRRGYIVVLTRQIATAATPRFAGIAYREWH